MHQPKTETPPRTHAMPSSSSTETSQPAYLCRGNGLYPRRTVVRIVTTYMCPYLQLHSTTRRSIHLTPIARAVSVAVVNIPALVHFDSGTYKRARRAESRQAITTGVDNLACEVDAAHTYASKGRGHRQLVAATCPSLGGGHVSICAFLA